MTSRNIFNFFHFSSQMTPGRFQLPLTLAASVIVVVVILLTHSAGRLSLT